MKILFAFLFMATAVLIMSSCSKENNPQPTATIVLSKVIDLDTTSPSGTDSLIAFEYEYDAAKRLNHTLCKIYNSNGGVSQLVNTTHYYNGTDSFPFKEVETVTGSANYEYTRFNTYSGNTLIFDSVLKDGTPQLARRYTYGVNTMTVITFTYTPTPLVATKTFYLARSNGNTVSQIDTTNGVISNFSFSYDTQKNPFAGKPLSPFIENPSAYYNMEVYTEEMPRETNNAVEIIQASRSNFHYKYFYEYNADGFPTTAKAYEQAGGALNFKFKRTHIYKEL